MTVSLSSISLSTSFIATKKEGANQDVVSYTNAPTLADGTGDSQADDMWYSTGVLASGGAVEFDLTALTRTFLGNSMTQSFQNVKAIYIENTSSATGDQSLTVTATGAAPFTDFLNGESGNLKINAGSSLCFTYPLSGWNPVNGSADRLQLNDGGLAATYSIALLGVLS